MSRAFRYLHYDVFTSERLHGNQLAVVPDARGLTSHEMQGLAAEMAFSETTFILPSEADGTDVRMRIFTPGAELPMAGHPTVGSTFALAHEGVIAADRQGFTFGLGVGPTPVELEWQSSELTFVWMTQPLPEFGALFEDRERVAKTLGVSGSDLAATPAQVVSAGVPLLFIALSNREAVDRAVLDRTTLRSLLGAAQVEELPVFVFALEASNQEATVYSRMFAPTLGIAEDPATGGASGPLGGYLLHHDAVPREPENLIISHQGVAMGRPSRIHISVENDAGAMTRVRVGGQAVLVAEGTLYL